MTVDEERDARFALDVLRTPVGLYSSVILAAKRTIAKAVGFDKIDDEPLEKIEKLISDAHFSGQNMVSVIDVLQCIHGVGAGFVSRPSASP